MRVVGPSPLHAAYHGVNFARHAVAPHICAVQCVSSAFRRCMRHMAGSILRGMRLPRIYVPFNACRRPSAVACGIWRGQFCVACGCPVHMCRSMRAVGPSPLYAAYGGVNFARLAVAPHICAVQSKKSAIMSAISERYVTSCVAEVKHSGGYSTHHQLSPEPSPSSIISAS